MREAVPPLLLVSLIVLCWLVDVGRWLVGRAGQPAGAVRGCRWWCLEAAVGRWIHKATVLRWLCVDWRLVGRCWLLVKGLLR